MTTAQQIENEEFEAGYCASDRFAGFDHGDQDQEEPDTFHVVGRMNIESGQRVVVGVWSGRNSEGFAEVKIDGRVVFAEFDLPRALQVGRWWLAGCPA